MRLNTVIERGCRLEKHRGGKPPPRPTLKRLRSNSGEEFECEHLLLATGAQARKLDGRGNDVDNVFYLRRFRACTPGAYRPGIFQRAKIEDVIDFVAAAIELSCLSIGRQDHVL